MTTSGVFAFPSTDLALLKGGQVDFHFMGFNVDATQALVWTDIGTGATVTGTFPGGLASMSGKTLTAGTTLGTDFGTITVTSGSPATIPDGAPFLIRVRVFDSVDKLWVSPATLSLFTNRTDRIAHEFAHALGMLAEYGGGPAPDHTSFEIKSATATNVEPQWIRSARSS